VRQCPAHLDGATIDTPVTRVSPVPGIQVQTYASRCLPPGMEAMGEVMIMIMLTLRSGRRPEMRMTLPPLAVHVFPRSPRKVARGGSFACASELPAGWRL
jgi:hypothetical protein